MISRMQKPYLTLPFEVLGGGSLLVVVAGVPLRLLVAGDLKASQCLLFGAPVVVKHGLMLM